MCWSLAQSRFGDLVWLPNMTFGTNGMRLPTLYES